MSLIGAMGGGRDGISEAVDVSVSRQGSRRYRMANIGREVGGLEDMYTNSLTEAANMFS